MRWRAHLVRPCSLVLPRCLAGSPASAQAADVVHLFNGKDLSSFYTWLVNDHRADPDKVFSVVDNVDGAPAIRISGQKFGGITTHEEYETYRLVVEFRWGTVTWNPRTSRARDSGVLIHCQGADGNTGKTFNGPWMRSIEAQIIEGGVGDFLMVQGYEPDGTRLSPEMTATHVARPRWRVRLRPRGHAARLPQRRPDQLVGP